MDRKEELQSGQSGCPAVGVSENPKSQSRRSKLHPEAMLFLRARSGLRPSRSILFPSPSPPLMFTTSSRSRSQSQSQPSSPPFMAKYLVDRLSFPPNQALHLATKFLPTLTSPSNPDAVLSLLRHRASLSPSQLRRFVRCRPTVLSSSVPSNLLPKLTLLQSLLPPSRSRPRSLPSLVTAFARSFGYSLSRLAASAALLRSLLPSPALLTTALLRCPNLLSYHPDNTLLRNADLLRTRHGLSDPHLSALVAKSPRVLSLGPDTLTAKFSIVDREFGLSSASNSDYFLDAVAVATMLSKDGFLEKVELLRCFGFQNTGILCLFRKVPTFMGLQKEYMKRKLEFFIGTVGWSPEVMSLKSILMLQSLENKLLPRYQLVQGLQSRGLVLEGLKLPRMFRLSEEQFGKEFVHKFRYCKGSDLVLSYMETLAKGKRGSSSDELVGKVTKKRGGFPFLNNGLKSDCRPCLPSS